MSKATYNVHVKDSRGNVEATFHVVDMPDGFEVHNNRHERIGTALTLDGATVLAEQYQRADA